MSIILRFYLNLQERVGPGTNPLVTIVTYFIEPAHAVEAGDQEQTQQHQRNPLQAGHSTAVRLPNSPPWGMLDGRGDGRVRHGQGGLRGLCGRAAEGEGVDPAGAGGTAPHYRQSGEQMGDGPFPQLKK